jgi:REP element-mobilizing transposase RayT
MNKSQQELWCRNLALLGEIQISELHNVPNIGRIFVKKFYRQGFWGRQKYYRSAGGAPLAVLMRYIEAYNHD